MRITARVGTYDSHTVEALTKIAGDMGLTATEAVDLAQEALPQARLEAKVIEAAEAWRGKWERNEAETDDELAIVDAFDALLRCSPGR